MRLLLPTLAALLVLPAVAHADDYRPGIVPEGNNAYVHARRELRIAPFGESSVGLTGHTELSTYLAADAILFPNLLLEHQLDESDHYAMSFVLGAGAGALPMAVGFVLPFGRGAAAGGGVGFVWASIQSATAIMTLRAPDRALSVSINAGGFAMEGGLMAIGGAVAVGDSGAGGGAAPGEMHGMRTGQTAGIEVARTFGPRNALVAALDVWHWQPITSMDTNNGIAYPRVTWTHKWTRWSLTAGVSAVIDLPHATSLRTSQMPVSPYLNFAYTR